MSSPTHRTLWLLLVVALVASAGCLGGTTPDDTATDPTVTDAATPATTDPATDETTDETLTATTTQTATGSSGTQAHPLSSKRLATSHATSLQNAENFTLDYAIDMTQVTSTETQTFTFDWTVQANLATGAQAIDGTLAGDGFTTGDDNSTMQFDLYVSPDGTATQRSTFGDTVQYQQADAAQYDVSTYLTAMNATSALDPEAANFTYDGPTTVDGETLYVYTVSDLDQLYLPTDQADDSAFDDSSVSKFDLRLVVDDAGTLREMQYDLEVTEDGSKLNLHFELSYSELGTTTVEEPDWLDEAST
ncbi:hypothetical protein [Haloarchaeobius sp. HME9146]|uniref:DUF7537 family lipoprotein n=1 Tax=Haloarchaeobius sp. HME9146 TaxID=2978732 RepID=UPI0021C21DA4|nr:hypothetical protein [Haloarchaeobius sp. HME9146]MCT9096275.1 hypothetical protein [Haloarchaeobius sp. HME9146]